MPKGAKPEYETACRACGHRFRTTRVGKAAFYCHQPACDEDRRRRRATIPNARTAAQRKAERERAAERRAEQAAARAAERRAERERARAVREAEAERQRAERERRVRAERTERERRREMEKLGRELQRLRPQLARYQAIIDRLAELDPQPKRLTPSQASPLGQAPDLARLLDDLRMHLIRRELQGDEIGRPAIARAVAKLAAAKGLTDTRPALRALAVEVLVWERRLGGSGRELGIAAQALAA